MKKTKEEWDRNALEFYQAQAEARAKGATPVGAGIIRPGSRGVLRVTASPAEKE